MKNGLLAALIAVIVLASCRKNEEAIPELVSSYLVLDAKQHDISSGFIGGPDSSHVVLTSSGITIDSMAFKGCGNIIDLTRLGPTKIEEGQYTFSEFAGVIALNFCTATNTADYLEAIQNGSGLIHVNIIGTAIIIRGEGVLGDGKEIDFRFEGILKEF